MRTAEKFLSILPDLIGIVLFVIGVSVMLLLQISNNAPLKRKLFRWSLTLMTPLAIAFFWAANAPLPMILIMIPGIALIIFMNLRMIKFCDSCGKTLKS